MLTAPVINKGCLPHSYLLIEDAYRTLRLKGGLPAYKELKNTPIIAYAIRD